MRPGMVGRFGSRNAPAPLHGIAHNHSQKQCQKNGAEKLPYDGSALFPFRFHRRFGAFGLHRYFPLKFRMPSTVATAIGW